ncbi:Sigma-adaptin 3A [Pseudocyphellaria aurata]|nr:Sigma-adaptin 3A [Pseudocyphellaria aurata]
MSFYDEIELEDLTYHPSLLLYTYPCPCGDQFEICVSDMRDGEEVADTSVQQRLISEIFTLVSHRPSSACNFLPLPPLLTPARPDPSSSSSTTQQHNDTPSLITYRHYATLYFILISTSTESPLALLDLIQVLVEALDRLFENVCELDLIFNFETLHAVLGEMVVGGVVVETALEKVVSGVKEGGGVRKRPIGGGAGGGGAGAFVGRAGWGRLG